jgi:hypothetical protein
VDDLENERFTEWVPPKWGANVAEFVYVVDGRDINRADLISKRLYGTTELWWAILDYNRISDPFSLVVGQRLRIPNPEVVLSRSDSRASTSQPVTSLPIMVEDYTVRKFFPYTPIPHIRPPEETTELLEEPFLINLGFNVASGLSGNVHYQLQIASDSDFEDIISSRMTQTSTSGWFIYNPAANSGAGGYVSFPSVGIDGSTFEGQTVYYRLLEDDVLTDGVVAEYYIRWRHWISNIEGSWTAAPPLVLSS